MAACHRVSPMIGQRQIHRSVSPQTAGYIVLAVLVGGPATAFLLFGVDAGSIGLRGAGGPLVAFSAGVLSFLSPCVLPLVPIYVTHLAGASVENGVVTADRRTTFSHSLLFVLGLSVVFVTLGISVGFAGFFLRDHQRDIEEAAGLLLVAMGALLVPSYGARSPGRAAVLLLALSMAFAAIVEIGDLRADQTRMLLLGVALLVLWARASGLLRVAVLSRTFQVGTGARHSASYGRSFLVGGAFATGWTPCVGPILGGILTLAARSGGVWTGAYLLLAYSAGLGVPFLITGLALGDASRVLRRGQPYMPVIEVVSAVMMVGLGILLISGRLSALNSYFGFSDFNQGL